MWSRLFSSSDGVWRGVAQVCAEIIIWSPKQDGYMQIAPGENSPWLVLLSLEIF